MFYNKNYEPLGLHSKSEINIYWEKDQEYKEKTNINRIQMSALCI